MTCYDRYIKRLSDLSHDAMTKNLECLNKIIADNRDTSFGKNHGFDMINSLDDYRKRVPVSEYDYFREYALDEYEGRKNSLTSYEVYSFCRSSGSSGDVKIVPVTVEALNKEIHLIYELEDDILSEYGGKKLKVNMCKSNLREERERTLLITEIMLRDAYEKGILREEDYVGGFCLNVRGEMAEWRYAKLWAALLTEDVTIIESVFLYDVLRFFDYLKSNFESVLNGIENGAVDDSAHLPKDAADYLLRLRAERGRIDFLRREFEKGFSNIAKRIWPGLKVCIGISSLAYEVEEKAISEYLGDVALLYYVYGSSEAVMGFPLRENDYEYLLSPQNAFYEFALLSDDAEGKYYTLNELEVGESYEIILTTFSGLYRYRLNDVIKCKGYRGECPVIEFITRRNHAINIAGEKVTMLQVEKLAGSLIEEGIGISEFLFFADIGSYPYRYMGVVALDDFCKENGEVSSGAGAHFSDISDITDTFLGQINVDYADLRLEGDLNAPFVIAIDRKRYSDFINSLYYDYTGEVKPVHVLRYGLFDRACKWVGDYIGKG